MKKNNKGYMFTNRRHSKKAVMSFVFGVLCLLSMITVIYLSAVKGGDIPPGYGFTGLFATILSITGVTLGWFAVKENDRYKIFAILGILLNALTLCSVSLILYMGSSIIY